MLPSFHGIESHIRVRVSQFEEREDVRPHPAAIKQALKIYQRCETNPSYLVYTKYSKNVYLYY